MGERRALSDLDVAHLLEDLGSQLETPAGDAFAPIRARLAAESVHRRHTTARRGWQTRIPRLAFALFVVVAVLIAALVISPAARRAVADWLGVRGVLIEQHSNPPASQLGGRLLLGKPLSLAQARSRVRFTVLVPPASQFGAPAEAYASSTPSGGSVTLLYRARPGLPAAAGSNVGLLVTEYQAQIDDTFIRKATGAGVRFERLAIAGEPGYWFEGRPHEVIVADRHGRFFQDHARLAGNTLLWQHGSLTLRLESALTQGQAIRLAQSLVSQVHRGGT
jgi:hypothetical protein